MIVGEWMGGVSHDACTVSCDMCMDGVSHDACRVSCDMCMVWKTFCLSGFI